MAHGVQHYEYLLYKDRVIKYLPISRYDGLYSIRINKNEKNFIYFDFMFSVDNPEVDIDLDYILANGRSLSEIATGNFGYNGGRLVLQLTDSTCHEDYFEYHFHIKSVISSQKPIDVLLKGLIRNNKIDDLLK